MERTRPTAPSQDTRDRDDDVPALRPAPLAETPGRPDAERTAAQHEAGFGASAGPAVGAAETVAEAEAREVWRVAARLQAEAARRLDARSQSLADEQRPQAAPAAAFSRAEVEDIAVSAGIDPSFVALAWREVEAARHLPPVSDDRQRRASAYLGTEAERVSVTRTFRAAPDAVLAAMQRVLPADPYHLTLVDILGDADDLADTALVFDVPQVTMTSTTANAFSVTMTAVDLNRAVVTLHDLGDGRTEATVAADLRYSKDRNLRWAVGSAVVTAVVLGALAGWAGLAFGGAVAAVVVAVLAAVASGALVHRAYPGMYRKYLAKGEQALADMPGAVDLDLRSGGAFRPATSPPQPGDGSIVIA